MDHPSQIIDYVVFVLELIISLGIGIYYSKQQVAQSDELFFSLIYPLYCLKYITTEQSKNYIFSLCNISMI